MDENTIEMNNVETKSKMLTIVDLQNISSILDVACRRGAFSAAEMSSVGVVFDKLSGFLAEISDQNQPKE